MTPFLINSPFALLLFTWCSRLSCVLSPAALYLAVYINSNNSLLPVLYLVTHTVCANNTQAKFSSWQLSPAGQHHPQDGTPFAGSFGVSARLSFHSVKVCRCPPHSRGHGFLPWWPCARWSTAAKVLYCSRGGLKGGAQYVGPDVFAQLVIYPAAPAGRLALGAILPTFEPVGGLGGLMLQTSRRQHARQPQRPYRWPWPQPWRPWRSLSRTRLAPCARPCALQPWHGRQP